MANKEHWQCAICGDHYHPNFEFRILVDKETLKEIKVCEECKPDLFKE